MTGIILRLVIYAAIGLAIYFGIRKIWRDWSGQFKAEDKEAQRLRRERDLAERGKPGIIDLKRDKDGTYRPGDDDSARR
ncbi:hypothetical protein VW29_12710 [Devosia limi DSM 17137]|uniref:Uncharacterized protein n=1 Tax=Devosia limi DSM 17137 TaxID=1121477 RepID=A0A0F5LNQ1_9HYPH|nr:hypothetical protein [Devosia limi]KKB83958.1 hypothetical protein VW29_12710 [Devosia limi DSM 17137]SHE46214.1 hypothetical protein SAMN02745223_00447 [Devosia limi DSM 17137]